MAEAEMDADTTASALDGGTYEVIRRRLEEQADELKKRVGQLNGRRQELFGGTETTLLDTFHVQTEHNCVARDIVLASGNRLLFGYQLFLGLKRETKIDDVFCKLSFDGNNLVPTEKGALSTPAFEKDFTELFQYYKDARLLQLRRTETHLLMVFQTGARAGDIKVLRWALDGENISYIDNRGERDHTYPARHAWEWVKTTREMHVYGQHAHINIDDVIFVECIEGDFTIKVEDNTESGTGIFAEDVENKTQGLDDAEVSYANLETCIVLKVLPYQEQTTRYVVFNKQTGQAVRLDSIGISCQELPEGHGLIFPNGYYLSTGDYKVFPHDAEEMEFVRAIRAPNGEDIAYIYHHRVKGAYIILQYNLITREVGNPILCSGYARYPDGRLVLFRADPEPTRSHTMQVWQTPFEDEEFAMSKPTLEGSYLSTVGNRDLVRGISDVLHTCRLIAEQKPSQVVYQDLLSTITRILDSFHWLGHDEAFGLRDQLLVVQKTADQVIGEFDKVRELTSQATKRVSALAAEVKETLREIAVGGFEHIDEFVESLGQLRARRGQVETLRDVRYVDVAALDQLDEQLVAAVDDRSQAAVRFLLDPAALAPYVDEIAKLEAQANEVTKVADTETISERITELSEGLDLLMGVVNGLEIDNATARTEILERISEVYGKLNRAKAVLNGKRSDLGTSEGRAEFGAQFKILGQTVSNYLSLAKEPEQCDEFLGKLMVQLEELESKFIEFDEFAAQLAEKREEVYEAFQSRKQSLLDDRQRTANSLARAAERIVDGVRKRAMSFTEMDALNAYFAGDPMVAKLKDIVTKLLDLGDTVKADDLQSRLKAAREDGIRSLRDKSELFEGDSIKLGRHRFSVNTQNLEISLLPRDDGMFFHLSGTDYFGELEDAAFLQTKGLWKQDRVSENAAVYRSEYLVYQIVQAAEQGQEQLSDTVLKEAAIQEGGLLELVRRFSAERYEEGYERGLHDADAVLILQGLLHLRETCGLIRFPSTVRALAGLWWADLRDEEQRQLLIRRCKSLLTLRGSYGPSDELLHQVDELAALLAAYDQRVGLGCEAAGHRAAGRYIIEELGSDGGVTFVRSGESEEAMRHLQEELSIKNLWEPLIEDIAALQNQRSEQLRLGRAWVRRWLASSAPAAIGVADEMVLALCAPELERESMSARSAMDIEGLLGQHDLITGGKYTLRIDDFEARLGHFAETTVPAYRAYQDHRRRVVDEEREQLRLDEFKPRVLTSFVRNKLINDCYLPLIGDNLAKQMGAVGDNKRTDLMGLLLLISPPGYGKTTLMEYVASILGLTFMKINGPAIGHDVASLDPAEAPNATAAQELQKLNLSLEMGNNVMIYLDDIQHCNPEFLQKFISLCDGQRRIEGVWRGRTRTYDLRGKKVCVIMAGNPYTESGEKFQIPDMLANRADTYNLGDILGGHEAAFELSYLENCLTVNPVLNPVASRSQQDFYRLLRIAEGEDDLRSELEHPYSGVELDEICEVLRKLRRVQAVLLQVNQEYIASASMADEYRTEPAFKLQGSYRNMAKLAEKVVAVMNDDELEHLILDHYQGEAQTLTTGAESNLLKLHELTGHLSAEEQQRWADIKRAYVRKQGLSGAEDDPMANALLQLAKLNEGIADIGGALQSAAVSKESEDPGQTMAAALAPALEGLATALAQRDAGDDQSDTSGFVAALAPVLDRLAGSIEQLEAVHTAEQQRPIQVVNTLPKYYGRLYKHNIDVIEQSLQPTLEAISTHLGNADAIRDNLQKLVRYLRKRVEAQVDGETMNLGGEDASRIDE